MSFWSWMRKTYLQLIKVPSLNSMMFFIGGAGCSIAFVKGFGFFVAGYIQQSLVYLCVSGTGFVLGNYGWYREFAQEAGR